MGALAVANFWSNPPVEVAQRARRPGVNISAAARNGVADAVCAALEPADREAYLRQPEPVDTFWAAVEKWGQT